ncbi:hypothetical protein ABT237_22150 [Streptomyces sp. NPDC001581]|uniref:hypothetical protein n=1 Tax=Streptomyces sp. NPDC001581 TaxID=3154386 RepID=UPI00331D59DF
MTDTATSTDRWWALFLAYDVGDLVDEAYEQIREDLARHHGTPTTTLDGRFAVRLTVNADTLADAVTLAATEASAALKGAGHTGSPVRIEAMTEAEFDAEQAVAARAAAVPELMGRQEIAALLGVTPQRVNALAQTAAWKAAVAPVQSLRNGVVYLADQVRDFAANWDRSGGRPRKHS